jgi:2Fe-2S ferredoxin
MITVIYVHSNNVRQEARARVGDSLMETAITANIPGIEAICGGSCACGTCHVHVDEPWVARLDPPTHPELELLSSSEHKQPNSRLSCQVRASESLDGIVVRIPASQP